MGRSVLLAAVVLCAALVPSRAWAHPLVEQARQAYHAAELSRGLELLEEAEDGTDLTRDDLADLYLLRAMLHRAQRAMDLAEVALFRLAALDPDRQLGREVHPSLRRLFATVRERVPGPVRLEVSARRVDSRVVVRVSVQDDVSALTQGFLLHGRGETGTWRTVSVAELELIVPPDEAAEYWAEAIGPGGAVIATHASRASPSRVEAAGSATLAGGATGDGGGDPIGGGAGGTGGGDEGDDGLVIGLAVGGVVAVLAAAAIIIGVLASQPTDETQLGRPTVGALSSPLTLRFE